MGGMEVDINELLTLAPCGCEWCASYEAPSCYIWGKNPHYQVERVDWPQSQSARDCEEGPVFVCLS
jgi:hypothetical protein